MLKLGAILSIVHKATFERSLNSDQHSHELEMLLSELDQAETNQKSHHYIQLVPTPFDNESTLQEPLY